MIGHEDSWLVARTDFTFSPYIFFSLIGSLLVINSFSGLDRDERFLRELVVRLRMLREGKIEGVPNVVPWRDAKVICQEYHKHKDTESCGKVMDRK